jgi:hypothetical protein
MQPYLDIFSGLAAEREAEFRATHGLTIKVGHALDAAILKLLKPTWTTDGPEELLNTNGVFFGVWVDEMCVAEGRVRYNVHAKKLRFLKGDGFPAREFARAFRAEAGPLLKAWPRLTFPKGPVTLFEGDVPLNLATLKAETSALIDRFAGLAPLVDRMLAETPVGKVEVHEPEG